MNRDIRTSEDVMRMLDRLLVDDADRRRAGGSGWWDGFYADRDAPIPFFVAKPDESLVSWLERGLIAPGRALDLGCGPGRNALHLASLGFEVDAVDLSPRAVAWGRERAREADVAVRFHCADVFTAELPSRRYDLVYDSGCLHHLPPHRRVSYLELLDRLLVPGGHFGLACFASGAMGSELPDEEFYRRGSLEGGLAYTPEALRWIFTEYSEIELRAMAEQPPNSPLFGVPFLLAALFRRE
ncbi:methyltransferase family protein [Saccharopolyspora erythraea NRRL 2338]|uniref:Methyltransferase n=2 Tax=Saccharopolyspora erythraea TaxID=1836 RepID=A4FL56_SACEN|nr:class I SAM-dependent methyltransferase [Saccharopolyspora erythraea]EQD83753.1 SAM-dependent methyltransferase [Saccharopolyspora erythraea D]PFG98421.1 methyltransferase family protein [Saccharopolyspora erythraea NRRL 2338]QRK88489.1 methyltransferase domain-containing protein [Saccharopolyspora erythraea]CAM04781.1 methyltransferase [Saccharopolyspora erythraea NRRL 2338]